MRHRRSIGSILWLGLALCGVAQAQTPVSLTLHGPSMVYEATSAEYRAVVLWSDGNQSNMSAAWAVTWTSANPAAISISPFGSPVTLLTGDVTANAIATVEATFFGPTDPMTASKVVTVLDASSFPVVSDSLAGGWNLLGNSIGAPLNVIAAFGDLVDPVPGVTESILSVWKWDAVNGRWAFFTPTMTPPQLADYAAGKSYAVLQVVQPGEGYWVNTTQPVTLPARSAGPISLAPASLVNGWNLVATGQALTPPELNAFLSEVPPPEGTVAQSFVSLWAWDTDASRWLFYAPSLEASGGPAAVKDYADARGYLDFANLERSLGHGIGFWVSSSTSNPSSDLAPLGQAKAMFSELRTTVRAYTNDLKTGFLDAQSTRIQNELTGKVVPTLSWAVKYQPLIWDALRLFEDIRNGNTASYQVQTNATAGTVRATRRLSVSGGSVDIFCFSNDMTGTQVTSSLLTDATCRSLETDPGAYAYNFPDRTQVVPSAMVMAGATVNDFSYEAIRQQRLETWNGSSYVFVGNTQIGTTRTGTFSRTYAGATTNISSFALAGDFPSENPADDHDTVSLTGSRVVQDATNNIYRYSVTGSIVSKDAGGTAMITLAIGSGSYYDAKEDADGNPLPNSAQAVHVVGSAQTAATRFTGTLDLGAFAADADNSEYLPASSVFDGVAEDLSVGGAGTFLTGRLTVTLNNLASFHSQQPESAGNFLRYDTSFVGTMQAPSRPEMRVTAGSSRTGLDTYSITTNYSYGPVSVAGTGTLDTFNFGNSTLTLTNQDGVTVTFLPHADAVVAKDGVTLGVIPFGSAIVYFVDGYFESL
ncbi:MAG: hypothetical protein HYY78_02510 [Betaproteobacteria bacterium]|nr:hypothetical protein [Betaproteobacteria bacterium]